MGWKVCQHCHGSGKVQMETRPGKWDVVTCGACDGEGKINTGLI